MNNLTLVIPAKNEILPEVLEELKNIPMRYVVLEENDKETINAIKNFNCRIYQNGKGFYDALIQGINEIQTEFFVFLLLMGHLIQPN